MSHPAPTLPEVMQIGDWRYRRSRRLLSSSNQSRTLKPLLDRLLQRFLAAPEAVISREQLLADVWHRKVVNDEVLSRAVAELRASLNDDARSPRYIETVAKSGYRWVAQIGVPAAIEAPKNRLGQGRVRIVAAIVVVTIAVGSWFWHRHEVTTNQQVDVDLLSAWPLSADPRLDLEPRFDATGHVVLVRTDGAGAHSDLVMLERSGQGERILWSTAGRLSHPAPSPDGADVAVIGQHDGHCAVWLVHILDGRTARLADCADAVRGGVEWVDQGKRLLFTGDAIDSAKAPGLVSVDRQGGTPHRHTSPDLRDGPHVDPRLSADQSTLAYASLSNGERQLWLVDWPSGANPRALLPRPEPIFGHAFAQSGLGLWVAGDLTVYRALHWLELGKTAQLRGGRGAISVDVAHDGALVWSEATFDGAVWVRSPNGQWRSVAPSNRYESQPALSADGQFVALGSNRNGLESVLVVDLRTNQVDVPRLDPAQRWVRPSWSADGNALILTAYRGSRTALYRYQLRTGALVPLSAGIADAFAGIELGDRLLFRQGIDADATLMQRRTGSAHAERVDIGPISAFRANARWLAWVPMGEPSLWVGSLDPPHQSRVVLTGEASAGEAFTLLDDELVYASAGKLWRMRLPDGTPEPLPSDYLPDRRGPNLSIAADGTLAIARTESTQVDVMIATRKISR